MLPDCLIVPHIASASVATRTKMAVMAAENLRTGIAGQPLPPCLLRPGRRLICACCPPQGATVV